MLEGGWGGIRQVILEEKERGRRTRSLAAIKLIKMAFVLQAAYSVAREQSNGERRRSSAGSFTCRTEALILAPVGLCVVATVARWRWMI